MSPYRFAAPRPHDECACKKPPRSSFVQHLRDGAWLPLLVVVFGCVAIPVSCASAPAVPTPAEVLRQATYGAELEQCRHPDSGLYADYDRCANGVDAKYGVVK
ncbi:MAG: hypothetical protein ACHREM_32690 [Polyangiales bacterium]